MLILLLLFSLSSQAGTVASLLIKGTVPVLLEISITPELIATNLPLDQSQSSLKIATVSERSNSHSGYKVNIVSSNNGNLKRTTGTEILPYTLHYNGNSVNYGEDFTYSFTNASVSSREVRISYTANPNLSAGDYTDNITFTIVVN